MNKYIAAIDQGTTSTRCMIFDHGGQVVAADQREHAQLFAQPGWVEHDALEIWERTQQVVAGALAKSGIARAQLAAVGITNQRETTLLWDRHTGQPVHHAIVWQDTRTAAICARLARTGGPVCRSHSSVVSRWLVMPTAASCARAMPLFASAPATTCCVRSQISSASCSTQPGCAKSCACSRWSAATTCPPWSKIMQRVLVVPWSIAAMYLFMRVLRSDC